MSYSPVILPFIISGIVLLFISSYGFSRRTLPYISVYSMLMLLSSLGAFLYAFELSSVELASKVVFQKLNFSITLISVIGLLIIVLRLGGLSHWLAPGPFSVFLIEPVAALALLFFPGATRLFSYGYHVDPASALPTLLFSMGPLYWGHILYTYLLLTVALAFFASSLRDFQPGLRSQTVLFVAAIILPIAANAMYQTGLAIPRGVDWTSAALMFTGVATAIALFRTRLADAAPITDSVVARTMHDLALVVDSRSRLLDFNPSALAVIGADTRRAVGNTLEDLPSPWNAVLRPYAGAASAQETISVKLADVTRWYHLSISPLRAEGTVGTMGRLFLMHDVTEREEISAHLRESEERFRGFIEQTFEGIILFDEEGRVIEFNQSSERLTGLSRAEVLGMHAWQLMSMLIVPERRLPDSEAGLEARFRQALRTGTGDLVNRTIEATLQRPDGSRRHLRQYFFPIRTANGFRFGGISHDVTEAREAEQALRKSEEQLLQSQKMEAVGRLAGGIAHDFNNILTVIRGYCDMLDDTGRNAKQPKRQIAEISNAARRASHLTAQLLAFSRKQVLQPRVISLNALVRSMEGLLGRMIGEDIELTTRLQPEAGSIHADPGQIEQVIMNLAVNARDAMPDGGTLTLETARDAPGPAFLGEHPEMLPGEYVKLSAIDTGEGMSKEILPRIFEPFFTTKETGKGTGLGLSTAYGIVKQSNGFIYCASTTTRGTTFALYFPRVATEEAVERPPAARPVSLRGTETILLVEDEESVRRFIRTLLQKSGYAVIDAASGDEAIAVAAARGHEIRLLITDVVMPRMSGRELAEKVRALCPDIGLLYVSGYTEDAMVHHGMRVGSINFIQKPFRAVDLLRKIREILERRPR